jgi:hypothetical protein
MGLLDPIPHVPLLLGFLYRIFSLMTQTCIVCKIESSICDDSKVNHISGIIDLFSISKNKNDFIIDVSLNPMGLLLQYLLGIFIISVTLIGLTSLISTL